MKYLLCLLITSAPLLFQAQDSLGHDPGLLFDDPAFLQLPKYPAGDRGSLPGQNADLSPYCPTPGDQCGQHSCAGWAICHALTIRWAYDTDQTNTGQIDSQMLSPSFLYNQIKEGKGCHSGAYLHKGLELARTTGLLRMSYFRYNCADCSRQPNKNHLEAAARYKIAGYQRVFSPGDTPEDKIHNLLYALDWNNPVIVGILVTPNFHGYKKGQGSWRPIPLGGGTQGHALVVVGYDEDVRMLTLFNSFGSDWGDGGFVKMTFDDFVQQARYGVVVWR